MQRVLHISPVLPRRDGHGLERRAYRVMEALCSRYRVSLLTMTHPDPSGARGADANSMCDDVTLLSMPRWTTDGLARRALRRFLPRGYYARYRQPSDWRPPSVANQKRLLSAFAGDRFDFVHVHRLYMLPLLKSCQALAHLPARMDLDDIESVTRERLAALARLNGDRRMAYVMQRDADAYRAIERRELARFERIYVCSEPDRARLLAGGLSRVDVLPNVVEIPGQASGLAARSPGKPFVFLFVGTLDYYPNRDAVVFFCRDVVPLIRRRASRPFEVRIVADSGPERRRQVPAIPELSWAPRHADLGREYGAADAAIVPIRAGGGTRIKALEAFAHRTPVVSTATGVEGLDVEHGVHALIGDTEADLAVQAAAVMDDAALRVRLMDRAFALVQTAYSPAVLRRRVAEVTSDARAAIR